MIIVYIYVYICICRSRWALQELRRCFLLFLLTFILSFSKRFMD